MKRRSLTLHASAWLFVLIGFAAPASADMFLHLKDGRVIVLPVDSDEIDSIVYEESPGGASGRGADGPAATSSGSSAAKAGNTRKEDAAAAAPRFARLPSTPGPHVARLKALKPGQWLDLGPPDPDPRWGRARGRSWTTNMAFAPSLDGAFLYGEGIHGWYNPANGRYMDDLWLYDVMAHRWMNVHPGTDVRNPPELTVNEDGFVALRDGSPVPIATMVHGYRMTTWDTHRRWHLSMPNRGAYFAEPLPTVKNFLDENRHRLNSRNASPWIYDVTEDRWRRHATAGRSPPSGFGDTLIYIASIRKTFFYRRPEVWLYDSAANGWSRPAPRGPLPPFGIDATSCHDPVRNRIYIGGGSYPVAEGPNALWIYDIEENLWVDPRPRGTPNGNAYATQYAMMHCDLANDVVLLVRHRGEGRGVFVYEPDTNAWRTVTTALPRAWPTHNGTNGSSGFYHRRLNVHLFHVAGDSRDNGIILAYRYR